MTPIPKSAASYYNAQKGAHKELMLEMRQRILQVVPKADEVIKYNMPTFVLGSVVIAGLKSNKNHIGYYPYSGSVISQFPELGQKYVTTLGSIHIPLGQPLLKSEVKKLVKARLGLGRMRG